LAKYASAPLLACLLAAAIGLFAVDARSQARLDPFPFARGINLSGAAFNPDRLPGIHGTDYIYPGPNYLDYYKRRGFGVVRLPFLWERLQRTLFAELDRSELDRMEQVVAAARARNMKLILSPHNYGRYRLDGQAFLIGTPRVPREAFADFWRRLATQFKGETAIWAFGLMNEPHDMNGSWKAVAQSGLDAIRSADANRLVLVPGDAWSEAARWRQHNEDLVLTDPAGGIAYEAHQYFDADHTGTYKARSGPRRIDPELGIDRIRPFAAWLHDHKVRGVITEFGVPNDDPLWSEPLDRLLTWLAQKAIPWVYWAGGPWWGDYPLSIEPKNGTDLPIMSILTRKRTKDVRSQFAE
jgi:endoglucanase